MKIQGYETKLIKRGTYGMHIGKIKKIFMIKNIILFCLIFGLCSIYISVSIMLNNPNKSLAGLKMEIVKTGSMEPNIPVQSIVLIKRQDNYQMDDVINFIYKDESYTHRIVAIGDGIYKTKGDANNVADLEIINTSSIVGKVIYHSSVIGDTLVYIRNMPFEWFMIGIVTIFILFLIITSLINRGSLEITDKDIIRANEKKIRSYRIYQKKLLFCLKFGIKLPKKGNYDITGE